MSSQDDLANPYAAPTARIDDPNIPVANELAARGARLAAFLLDSLVLVVPAMIAPMVMFARIDPQERQTLFNATFIACGVVFLAFVVANLVLVFRSQQTIGKRLLRIKVVRTDGSRCNPWRMLLLRGFVPWLIDNIPLLGFGFMVVDPLLIFRDDQRCIHDFIADTIVVRT